MFAESAHLSIFGAETETKNEAEIRSTYSAKTNKYGCIINPKRVCAVVITAGCYNPYVLPVTAC